MQGSYLCELGLVPFECGTKLDLFFCLGALAIAAIVFGFLVDWAIRQTPDMLARLGRLSVGVRLITGFVFLILFCGALTYYSTMVGLGILLIIIVGLWAYTSVCSAAAGWRR